MINGNRSKSNRPRSQRDFYETPFELCVAALRLYQNYYEDYPRSVLDAGAGTGNWGKAANFLFPQSEITGIELDESMTQPKSYHEWINGDYLQFHPNKRYSLICGNPPYSLAEEFITHSLELIDNGDVFFLLRLEFLASQNRGSGLFFYHPPKRIWVSSRRPSFYMVDGKHTTDTLEYAMMLWDRGTCNNTELRWFNWTYDD